MNTLLNALHVVTAVLVTGPLVGVPFAGRWLIGRRNAEGVRLAANLAALFGVGILVAAGFGVATLLTSHEWAPTTPWVVVAATLFVVALGLVWGYAVPALRTAASLVGAEVAERSAPLPAEPDHPAAESTEAAGDEPDDASGNEPDDASREAEQPEAPAGGRAEPAALPGESAEDIRRRHRLDSISARVTGAGWLLLATFAAITVLMTVRPFG